MPDKPSHVTGTLLTIGDEILLGDIPNENARHIASELRACGFRLDRMITVGDIEDDIVEHLGQCLKGSHFVIVTGGLGPTDDDRTCSAASRALNRPLVCNRDYAAWLKGRLSDRGVEWSREIQRMAELPEGAVKLGLNMAGFFILHDGIPCYFLPGVPGEMKQLLGKNVIPDLQSRFPERCAYLKHIVRVQGLLEAQVNSRLRSLEAGEGVDIAYYPQGHENWVSIFVSASNEQECRSLLMKAEEKVISLIGARYISGHNDDCLEKVIGRRLRERGYRLAVAESCTGGLLSGKITSVAGASDYLDRAFVTYSNRAKTELLGVSEELLRTYGAVSSQVALAMAEGALRNAEAQASVATTGIAGPGGGTAEKPVGTVFIACITPGGKKVQKYLFAGTTREQIQESAAQASLVMLWKLLTGDGEQACNS